MNELEFKQSELSFSHIQENYVSTQANGKSYFMILTSLKKSRIMLSFSFENFYFCSDAIYVSQFEGFGFNIFDDSLPSLKHLFDYYSFKVAFVSHSEYCLSMISNSNQAELLNGVLLKLITPISLLLKIDELSYTLDEKEKKINLLTERILNFEKDKSKVLENIKRQSQKSSSAKLYSDLQISELTSQVNIITLELQDLRKGYAQLQIKLGENSSGLVNRNINLKGTNNKIVVEKKKDKELISLDLQFSMLKAIENNCRIYCLLNLSSTEYACGDGNKFGNSGSIQIRSKGNHKVLRQFSQTHSHLVWTMITIDSDTIISGSFDNSVRVWRISELKLIKSMTKHTGFIRCLVHISGSLIASGGSDKIIYLWDYNKDEPEGVLIGHSGSVQGLLMYDSKDTLLSVSDDKSIRLWSISKSEEIDKMIESEPLVCVLVISKGVVAVGTIKGSINFWEFSSRQCLISLKGHTDSLNGLIKLSDQHLASYSNDKTIRIWDLKAYKQIKALEGHSLGVNGLVMLNNTQLISCGLDKRLIVWG